MINNIMVFFCSPLVWIVAVVMLIGVMCHRLKDKLSLVDAICGILLYGLMTVCAFCLLLLAYIAGVETCEAFGWWGF